MNVADYNSVVDYYNNGMEKCCKYEEDQQRELRDKITELCKEFDNSVEVSFGEFTKELESSVSGWSGSDYDQFVSMAEHDSRLSGKALLTISAAYANTHKGDEHRTCNNVCMMALKELEEESNGDADE